MLVLSVSFSVALLDQATKYLIRRHLVSGHITVIPGIMDLRYVQNTGAAWGILEGLNNWLVVLSVIMLIVIIVFRRSLVTDALIHRIAMGLMVGGIVGNLIDRLRLAYVVDFLDFYLGSHHFPAFNVADSAICVGVGLYVISQIIGWKRVESRESADDGQRTTDNGRCYSAKSPAKPDRT